ncbi:sigma-70 family RNA polymerase sigma factor [Chitinophaga polysaccharea]|uniref:RNA polymerase sigma factor n=1 Tax=Chitinophaga TaxID=79328 RepID=UPI001455DA6B|nr:MULTISPECIES: sigma-70 family RNA polymerase sigma factor [Chitinophaga]NLR59994.1 sigma-70 family RNA polymerase sigma factor [Chitinophaga polysaccharea]NLU94223.1 sigma-70 family RNA polymerase sigma factor [Chitinophaga sp. Ak27]
MAHISEQQLIERLLVEDPAARELLYDRYAGALYNMVLQLVPVKHRANEVIVKVFNWAFHHIGTFHSSGYQTLFAWLMRKAREFAIKEVVPETALTGTELIRQEEGILQRFYLVLPADQQQVFRLSYFKGLSITTIARLLALPDEQINDILGDAMRSFRQFLKDTWN